MKRIRILNAGQYVETVLDILLGEYNRLLFEESDLTIGINSFEFMFSLCPINSGTLT